MRPLLARVLLTTVMLVLGLDLGLGAAQAGALSLPSPLLGGGRADVNELGQAVVGWAGPAGVRAVIGDRAGGFGSASALSATGDTAAAPLVAIDDHGDALVVWETTRTLPGSGCSTCGSRTLSTGVWAALRPAGSSFGAPVLLRGPLADAGADLQVAEPRLAMSPSGDAVIAWSDGDGAGVALRAAGGPIGAPQRVATAGARVRSVAISATGEALIGDLEGRVLTRPAGGAFGPPQLLPGAFGVAGVGALVAANSRGDAIAAYPTARGPGVSRRPAGGDWAVPEIISAPPGSGLRSIALADTGAGAVTYVQSVDPRSGRHDVLFAALTSPSSPLVQEAASRDDLDADMTFDGTGLDTDATGDIAIAWERFSLIDILFGRRVAQIGLRRSGGAFGPPVTLTPAGAEHAMNDTADVAIDARGELLATWTDHHPKQVRLNARWFGADGATTSVVLDTAAVTEAVLPAPAPAGHYAAVMLQTGVTPSRRGRIPVSLNCVSFDHRACKGLLMLTYGKRKVSAGRAHFKLVAGRPRRVYVTLTRRSRATLRRNKRLSMIATAVTTKPGGGPGRSSEQVFVSARRNSGGR
jgi:hypothetical protein